MQDGIAVSSAATTTGPFAAANREPSGRLLDVRQQTVGRLTLSARLSWLERLLTEIPQGGQYLISGAPGSCKSTLLTQLGLDLAAQGVQTLFLLTEESPHRLRERVLRMSGDWSQGDAQGALARLWCDERLSIDRLPGFLYEHVLSSSGRYAGSKAIVLDSIQGHGLPSTSLAAYTRLFEFCRIAKSAGISTFLVGHMTKKGLLSGPRDLEHNVEAVIVMRKVMGLRVVFVTKNRFGIEQLKGFPLVIDPVTTTLRPSPHLEPVTGMARTFLGGGLGVGEMQAMVSLPSHNGRPQIQAPGLPRRRIEQLLNTIGQVPGLEMDDLNLSIGCLMPGEAYFRPMFGLPLCLALIGSYLRLPVPPQQIQLGEVDLARALRPLSPHVTAELASMLSGGELEPPLKILCPSSAAPQLPGGPQVELVPCARLDEAIRATWPAVELS